MSARMLIGLSAVLVLGVASVCGGDEKKTPSDQAKRIAYVVKHGNAKDLAAALNKHFQGDAEVVALPEPNGNFLLIRANPATFDEVIHLLGTLDRTPRSVAVELIVADVMLLKATEKGVAPKLAEVDEKVLFGPAAEVLARLEALQKSGKLSALNRYQVTGVENQPAKIMEGGTKPVVSGTMVRAVGGRSSTITYRNVGTQVAFTPHVAQDGTISLELAVENVRLLYPEDNPVLGEGDNGPIRAADIAISKFDGKVAVTSGRAQLLQGVKTESKTNAPTQTLMFVTARVVEQAK